MVISWTSSLIFVAHPPMSPCQGGGPFPEWTRYSQDLVRETCPIDSESTDQEPSRCSRNSSNSTGRHESTQLMPSNIPTSAMLHCQPLPAIFPRLKRATNSTDANFRTDVLHCPPHQKVERLAAVYLMREPGLMVDSITATPLGGMV